MSLNGMAESRRLWCHRKVWLKCSKTVARRSQALPVGACRLPQENSQDNRASLSVIARILCRGPGQARLLCSLAARPKPRARGTSNWTHGRQKRRAWTAGPLTSHLRCKVIAPATAPRPASGDADHSATRRDNPRTPLRNIVTTACAKVSVCTTSPPCHCRARPGNHDDVQQ